MATSKRSPRTPVADAVPSFFSVRSFVLTVILLVGYWLLISVRIDRVNPYEAFHANRIAFYYDRLDTFARVTSLSQRMILRHSYDYNVPFLISQQLGPTDTLLLPPAAYAERYTRGNSVVWTDPRIYTYMVGRSPIVAWDDTLRRSRANTVLALELTMFELIRRGSSQSGFDSVVAEYHASRAPTTGALP